jgi:hypothetical protein
MKVTETIRHQDGASTTREFNIPMRKSNSEVVWSLSPSEGEEPITVKILKSGWKDQGEEMYHVLTEYGAYEETSYSHLNKSQLLKIHPEFFKIIEDNFQDIVVESSDFYNMPNDQTIGRFIRNKSINKK